MSQTKPFSNLQKCTNYSLSTAPAVKDKMKQVFHRPWGKAIGNYVVTVSKPTIVSTFNVVPKPDSSETYLIHDCSHFAGYAVNDYADVDRFKSETLGDAIKVLIPGYYTGKIVLRHAYCSIRIY